MQYLFEILRRESAGASGYVQEIPYETADEDATCASALTQINAVLETPVRWECSCLQKKCGACAMVINGNPMLACDAKLGAVQKKGRIRLEPLRKFPVIADLIVDRSILFENLRTLSVWLETDAAAEGKKAELAYEASRCLQCGCCLEICPNFSPGDTFFGMASFVPAARLIAELPPEDQQALRRAYRTHIYEGCGKSLACRDVCPAGIPLDRLLLHTNAASVWKRR